jgi:cytochrome c
MKSLALVAASLLVSLPALAAGPEDLAKSKNCMACHGLQNKIVGPAYKDVAAKYAKDKDAVKKLSEKVIKGGSGAWGAIPMPANNVTPAEAETLVKWVLTIK